MAKKTHRLLELVLVLALLVMSGRAASVLALPGQVVPTTAREDAAVQRIATPAGDIVQAGSCSQEDVQAAIDAASDGDFVVIPPGTCTWTTSSDSVPAVLISGKAITLQGAGVGQTIITDETGTCWNNSLIRVDGTEEKPFRIIGFTFTEVNAPTALRVSGKTPLGGMQINRLAKLKTKYAAKHFKTEAEAEAYLDSKEE